MSYRLLWTSVSSNIRRRPRNHQMRLEPFPALRVLSFSPLRDFRLLFFNNSQKEERGICVCAFIIEMLKGPSRVRRAPLLCSSGQRPAAPLSPSLPARTGRSALTPWHRRACTAWLPRFPACIQIYIDLHMNILYCSAFGLSDITSQSIISTPVTTLSET